MSKARAAAFGKLFDDAPQPKQPAKDIAESTVLKQIVFKANQAAKKQIDMMAVERGETRQTLFVEMLNDFFVKHGKPPIA